MEFKRVFRKFLEMYWEETFLLVAALFAAGMLLCPESTIFWVSWSCVVLVFLGVAYSLWRKFRQSVRETEWEKEQRDCRKNSDPIFLEDKEIEDEEGDKLGVVEDARHFGEQVLNGGSNNAMVFGLDAAWGSGKSSFLNLCEKGVWETKENKKKVAVFTFKPVLYDASIQDIAGIFIGEFSSFLKKEKISFDGLGRDGKMLARLVSGVSVGGDFLGVNFRFPQESLDSVLGKIKDRIKLLPRRVIVIVDDLDRLYLEEVKAILGVVRNIFNIPKISFVLCYDTSNINSFEIQKKIVRTESYGNNRNQGKPKEGDDREIAPDGYSRAEHEPDNERLNAYFEKIVQVKRTLIPRRTNLLLFLLRSMKLEWEKAGILKEGDRNSFEKGINEFFEEKSYSKYCRFIGDIRKIKRFFNVLQALDILKFGINDRDINPQHLFIFVLVYINFSKLFREIYVAETDGVKGTFSVKKDGDKYLNSDEFHSFLKRKSEDEQFLLHELFCAECAYGRCRRSGEENLFDNEFLKEKLPLFNGGWGIGYANTESYLDCVYKHKQDPDSIASLWKGIQYANHKNKLRDLSVKPLEDIFQENEEYLAKHGERSRDLFFRLAQTKELPFSSVEKVVEYITRNLSRYSMVSEFSGVYEGIRDGLVYRLMWMLELRGWRDERGESYGNSDENIAVLAERILGGDRNSSLVDTILESGENPILSVNDATRFIYACTDTSSQSLFNVRRSLENYAKKQSINAMEALSRRAFRFFHENLIGKKRNFLREIADMDEVLLLGDFSESIRDKFEEKGKSLEEELEKIKNGLAVALVSRFARDEEHSMGMYSFDPASPNPKKISEIMRDYLFHICFNPDGDARNAEFFINFGLASFENDSTLFHEWVPNIPFLEKAFGSDRLRDYWRENGERIKNSGRAMLSTAPEKKVVTYNYVATYREHMEKLFGKLDEFMKGKDF